MAGKRPSKREQAFILYYTGEALFNGAEAARLANYAAGSARQTAHKLLTKDYIKEAIQSRIKELTMSADEVMVRLSEHGRGNIGQFVGKSLRDIQTMPEARLIKTFDHHVTGSGIFREEHTKIELYSAQAALLHLWKHHQLAQGKATDSVDVVDAKERLAQLLARQSGRGESNSDPGGTE